MTSKVSTVSK